MLASRSHTSAGLGQLDEPQQRVVAGDGLEGNVRVPLSLLALLLLDEQAVPAVDLLGLLGRNDANLIVLASELPARVGDGMDVQLGRGRLAAELTEALHKLLLEIVGDVVLLTEENHTTAGD